MSAAPKHSGQISDLRKQRQLPCKPGRVMERKGQSVQDRSDVCVRHGWNAGPMPARARDTVGEMSRPVMEGLAWLPGWGLRLRHA